MQQVNPVSFIKNSFETICIILISFCLGALGFIFGAAFFNIIAWVLLVVFVVLVVIKYLF